MRKLLFTTSALAVLMLTVAATKPAPKPAPKPASCRATNVLRVCSDPNNLPFSNSKQQGFENEIANVIAKDLGVPVEYTWWAQRRGFIRNTLRSCKCDVIMGVPDEFDPVESTRPYYRSTYVFVTRADRNLHIRSLDDPRLRTMKIGVQIVGDDGANPPPGHSLAKRGIIDNVHGYTVYGNYSEPNPPARVIDAVARGDVDVAIAWGPLAGYFASREPVKLAIEQVVPDSDGPLPFSYSISLGVRPGDDAWKAQLESILARHKREIDAILDRYGVPRKPLPHATQIARRGE